MHDDITISSIHRYSTRFLRSTDLVRDFHDPKGLEGYKLTDFGHACLNRIADGLRTSSSNRAWRLTGDFGSGKSSFALLLANTLRDKDNYLPMELRDQVLKSIPEAKSKNFIPVLVMGNREPMAYAIIRALHDALTQIYTRGAKSELLEEIEKVVHQKKVSDQKALDLIKEAKDKIIQNGKGCGILLIMDEVGKFLEFAALNPEQQDVFFLQQLAEIASRSGKQPLLVVCLLHQGFNAYSEQLDQATQREWEKVAGRFEEILFRQPLDQIALLIASAISPDKSKIHDLLKEQADSCLTQAIELGWYGTSASRETLRRLPSRLFPLDPMLLPVLVRIFQRYGQNERSLFSFLCSHEPFGLNAFSQQILNKKTRPFQLSDFYDYVRANFGHKLAVASHRAHWTVIESVIEAHNPDNPLEIRVLKTIGILNLLDADDLRPTKEAIMWAVGGKSSKEHNEVLDVLRVLAERRILYFRGDARGYSLWPYTSVDIESRLDEAKRAIPSVGKISDAIAEQLDARPIVARAHYIRTGNLRYFDVVYCKPEELMEQSKEYKTSADGFILVPLCETEAESKTSISVAKALPPRHDLIRIVAVPRALVHLTQAALNALRWEWVQKNTLGLNNDRFAREEVYLNSQEARNLLQSQVQQFIGLNRITGQSSLRWFYSDKDGVQTKSFDSGRQALRMLSDLSDQVYDKAPRIKNELANRHNLSSAAAAARMRLLELMFLNADKPDIGLPADRKPPEKSMYLSILRKTKIHRKFDEKWGLAIPSKSDDQANVAPTLKKIRDYLFSQPDSRIQVSMIMEELRRPPFGLRDGVFPLFLAIVAIQHEQEIAFYENGTFLSEIGKDAFLRLIKAPQNFEIQFCKIEGIRSELFQRLANVLELPKKDLKFELLDVVRNLCGFVAQLPEYTRNTKRLSQTALAVRTVILEAREPVLMLFHDLPVACGFHKFEVGSTISPKEAQRFVEKLKDSLNELRMTLPSLQKRMTSCMSNEFGYEGQALSLYRKKLAERAEQLLLYVSESRLKAFAFRLFDEALPEAEWLESVGSFLALRPPNKWKDEEEDTFERELAIMAGRFKRAESLGFKQSNSSKKHNNAIRVSVTQLDGSERQEVIHFDKDEEYSLKELQNEIMALICKNKRLGVAAASRAIWSHLKSVEEIQ